jgi:protocatechuate 3,4-dioxygenase beta subunit
MRPTRRQLLEGLGAAAVLGAAGCDKEASEATDTAPPESCEPTPEAQEGPNYLPGADSDAELCAPDRAGEPLEISGQILDMDCRPVAGAAVDVWQAEPEGGYTDSADGDFRGAFVTDEDGRYGFRTRLPGYEYSETGDPLPLHIHYKIASADHAPLTTILYFADDAVLESPSFNPDPALIIDAPVERDGVRRGTYDITLTPLEGG